MLIRQPLIATLILAVLLTGCTSGEKQAAQLLETARFEEKQNNREHAEKLYREIIRSYPESSAAREASERLKTGKK